jgi:hypothetical protein
VGCFVVHRGDQGAEFSGAGHRTPIEIARSAAAGNERDRNLWRDYEAATKGRHAVQWSRGLKARLGVGEPDDEDLATEDQAGEVIATLDIAEWADVRTHHLDTYLLDLAEADRDALDHQLLAIVISAAWEREQRAHAMAPSP